MLVLDLCPFEWKEIAVRVLSRSQKSDRLILPVLSNVSNVEGVDTIQTAMGFQ